LDRQVKKQGFRFVTIDTGGYKSGNRSIFPPSKEMR
jgi:PP-loop superfamily ATP-utilizing enzyme